VVLQGAGEVVAGELAALVGVEDLGAAVQRERFLNIAGNGRRRR
jgi:hypothetical protein